MYSRKMLSLAIQDEVVHLQLSAPIYETVRL